jgi:RNA polymerase primary sigma factor
MKRKDFSKSSMATGLSILSAPSFFSGDVSGQELDIDVVNELQGLKVENENFLPEEEQEITEYEEKFFPKRLDPVAVYLKEIGSFPLLTREGEIEIARRIETGKQEILNGLLSCPLAVREVISLGKELHEGRIELTDLTNQVDDEEMTVKEKESQKKRVLSLIDKIRKGKDRVQLLQRRVRHKGSKFLKREILKEIRNKQAEIFDALNQVDLKEKYVKRIVQKLKEWNAQMDKVQMKHKRCDKGSRISLSKTKKSSKVEHGLSLNQVKDALKMIDQGETEAGEA